MDKQIIQARTLSGFRDLLPQEALAKEDMIRTVSDIFRSFSFAPIETPHLEYEETLVDISEDDVQKEMYRFEDHGGRRVALRFDQTLPLARYVVEHKNDLALPFRRYAIGNVFRGERPQKGRYREFTQCDFDCVGSDSSAVDAEVIAITAAAITVLGISDFTIAISNRKILNGYLQTLHLESQAESILRIVDKKAKISAEEFERLLTENCNGDTALAHDIAQSVSLSWEDIQMKQGHNDLLDQGIQELEQIISLLAALGVDAKNYTIDLSIVRGLGYYTGMVFETTLDALPNFGSVCSGGRYDTLTQKFSKELTPATGAGLGLDRLFAALQELGILKLSKTPAQVCILNMDTRYEKDIYSLSSELRSQGVLVEVYPEVTKIQKQFKYANKKGYQWVIMIGQNEHEQGGFLLKNMTSGEQILCQNISDLISAIAISTS